ncbi:MAG: DUF4474 domain-containing protein [Anaerocolumna sp.]
MPNIITTKSWELLSKSEKNIALNNDLAPWGFAYYEPQDLFYSIKNGWQRNCGYCYLYDDGTVPLSMVIDCEPIYFEYAGKNWLIEFWKGQYGMATGCEIGVYNTTDPVKYNAAGTNITLYHAVEDVDQLYMSCALRKKNTIILQRGEVHWWVTAFKLAEFSNPSELIMSAEVTLKDNTMTDAFVAGMITAGYKASDLMIRGNSVAFNYDVPYAKQPASRTPVLEFIMQTNNHRNCLAYNIATKYIADNTLDRLIFVKEQAPKLYRYIMDMANRTDMFKNCEKVKDILENMEAETKAAHLIIPDVSSAYNSSIQIEKFKSL